MSLFYEAEDVVAVIRRDGHGWIPDDEATRLIVELVEAKERFAHRAGYQVGEMERIALATANSELRSETRCLKEEIRRLR